MMAMGDGPCHFFDPEIKAKKGHTIRDGYHIQYLTNKTVSLSFHGATQGPLWNRERSNSSN